MKNSYYHLIFEGSNIFQLILTVAKQSRRFSAFSEKTKKTKTTTTTTTTTTHTHKNPTHLLMWRIQLIKLKFLSAGDSKIAKQRFVKNIINVSVMFVETY